MAWTSVKEELPVVDRLVMIHEEGGRMIPARLCDTGCDDIHDFYVDLTQLGFDLSYPTLDVTHWRPMPRRPSKRKKKGGDALS